MMMETKRKRTRICLHGNYHTDNFGDILLMALFSKWIREYAPSSILSLPFASEGIRRLTSANGGTGYRTLAAADGLIYGGGGYFGEPGGSRLRWGNRLLARHIPPGEILRARRRPYAILGVGAGPISNKLARMAVVRLCRGATTVAVRDDESRHYLIDYGVPAEQVLVTSDAAMALRVEDLSAPVRNEAKAELANFPFPFKVGVHVSFPSAYNPASRRLIEELCAAVGKAPDAGCVLLVDQAGANPQVDAVKEIREKLGGKSIVIPYQGPWFLSAVLSELDFVITTKLHVGIVATAFNRQVLSFPTHAKTPRFYRQVGWADRCLPLSELKAGEAFDRICSLMNRASVHDPIRDSVKKDAARNRLMVKEVVENFTRGS
ncbi:MAG: polysaccharide pyruvyl transferase family protein [Opitutales bacterium]